mgnify:CR=1 FL=1
MTDLKRKNEVIRSIEHLQLSKVLICALDDAHQAESIAEAIDHLKDLASQWN